MTRSSEGLISGAVVIALLVGALFVEPVRALAFAVFAASLEISNALETCNRRDIADSRRSAPPNGDSAEILSSERSTSDRPRERTL